MSTDVILTFQTFVHIRHHEIEILCYVRPRSTILSSLSHNEDVWKVQISHVIEIQIVQPQFTAKYLRNAVQKLLSRA